MDDVHKAARPRGPQFQTFAAAAVAYPEVDGQRVAPAAPAFDGADTCVAPPTWRTQGFDGEDLSVVVCWSCRGPVVSHHGDCPVCAARLGPDGWIPSGRWPVTLRTVRRRV